MLAVFTCPLTCGSRNVGGGTEEQVNIKTDHGIFIGILSPLERPVLQIGRLIFYVYLRAKLLHLTMKQRFQLYLC
jgi:hypothetical protein